MNTTCPICNSETSYFFRTQFLRNAEQKKDDRMVHYYRCPNCDYIFAPEFKTWTQEDFKREIYNEKYIEFDPEFLTIRPMSNAVQLNNELQGLKHLDYGGGNGVMSERLRQFGVDSTSYDVFYNTEKPKGKYDIITCIEVIEHTIDPLKLFFDINDLLKDAGTLILKTSVVDFWDCKNEFDFSKHWYVMPRNGHIGFYSIKTLQQIADKTGFKLLSKDPIKNIFKKIK